MSRVPNFTLHITVSCTDALNDDARLQTSLALAAYAAHFANDGAEIGKTGLAIVDGVQIAVTLHRVDEQLRAEAERMLSIRDSLAAGGSGKPN